VATIIIGRVLVLPPISLTVPGHSFRNDSIRFCWVLSEIVIEQILELALKFNISIFGNVL
jgi:hypothetical protein